jgi:hypothetical protein
MEHNPYEPPHAPVTRRNREPGSIPKAVATGAVIDIGGTMLGGILLGFAYSILLAIQGRTAAEVEQALTKIEPFSLFGLTLMAMGMAMSALGGYQCAVVANRVTYLAPGIMSLISVTSSAMLNNGQVQLPELLLLSGLTVAAILGGASLHIRKLTAPPPSVNEPTE